MKRKTAAAAAPPAPERPTHFEPSERRIDGHNFSCRHCNTMRALHHMYTAACPPPVTHAAPSGELNPAQQHARDVAVTQSHVHGGNR